MNVVLFCHSLRSDWNHKNAHFLRGIAAELGRRGHSVRVLEPREGWSAQDLTADAGAAALSAYREHYPSLEVETYDVDALDLDRALEGASLVLVHEWSAPELVRRIGAHRVAHGSYCLLFHDTHHRLVTAPQDITCFELSGFDGILAFGEVLRERYAAMGWGRRAFTWHEAADTHVFYPRERRAPARGLVWIGNFGDEERRRELSEFLIEPVRALGLPARVHGVRYPEDVRAELAGAGIEYRGWLANFDVPGVFAQFDVTVHVPRRPYVAALHGIPTIRPFEALACGIPLISAPWHDSEGLFTPGEDFLVVQDRQQMTRALASLTRDPDQRAALARRGLETIRARHTCSHRVDELLQIVAALGAPAAQAEVSGEAPASSARAPSSARREAPSRERRVMRARLNIAFFGSSLVSSSWNGAATYYRGLLRALAARGHMITFHEPETYDRQRHRDSSSPSQLRVVAYPGNDGRAALQQLHVALKTADVVVKVSGIGVQDRLLEQAVPASVRGSQLAIFWDADAPATLERLRKDPADPFRARIAKYDAIFTIGGSDAVVSAYSELGARACVPIHDALDPEAHHPVPPVARYRSDLSLLANRLPDREERIGRLFFEPARRMPERRFLLGGNGWASEAGRSNVALLGHVPPAQYNAFNCSALAVLNVARDCGMDAGFSPATGVFEAAGAASCIITDAGEGIAAFLEPDKEVLIARDADQVVAHLDGLTETRAHQLGAAAQRRVLAHHTYGMRALLVEDLLSRGTETLSEVCA